MQEIETPKDLTPNKQNLNQQQGNSEQFRSNQPEAAPDPTTRENLGPRDGQPFIDPKGSREMVGIKYGAETDDVDHGDIANSTHIPGGEVF